jgi:DNA-binding response OmpR family regulator
MSSEDRVRGLNARADDLVAKPCEVVELAARIRAVVRRGNRVGHAVLQVSDLEFDRITHGVQRPTDLSPKEFSLLKRLMRHAGQPVSRPAIVEQVWKLNCGTMTNEVDVHINYLRRKVDVRF